MKKHKDVKKHKNMEKHKHKCMEENESTQKHKCIEKNECMQKHKKEICIVICIILFIILDQISKIYLAKDMMLIEGILKFSNVYNTGGAFGIFNTSTIAIILLNVIVLGLMIRFVIIKKDYMSKSVCAGLLLIISGGLSNLIDRIFRGYVVDFIDLTQIINFPVFNIADIVLVCGWILLIIGVVKDLRYEKLFTS